MIIRIAVLVLICFASAGCGLELDSENSDTPVRGPGLQASGSLNGVDIAVSCQNPTVTCRDADGFHIVQCYTESGEDYGVMGDAGVALVLLGTGPNTVNTNDSSTSIKLGADGDALSNSSSNKTSHGIFVPEFVRLERGKGEFGGTWEDRGDGAHFGSIEGTFDFDCP